MHRKPAGVKIFSVVFHLLGEVGQIGIDFCVWVIE